MLTSYPLWHSVYKIWTRDEWGTGLVCQNGGRGGLLFTDHIFLLFFQQFARDVTRITDPAASLTIASKTIFLYLFCWL